MLLTPVRRLQLFFSAGQQAHLNLRTGYQSTFNIMLGLNGAIPRYMVKLDPQP